MAATSMAYNFFYKMFSLAKMLFKARNESHKFITTLKVPFHCFVLKLIKAYFGVTKILKK